MHSTIEIASGARAVEELLLDAVAGLQEETRRDPLLLARPVRVVVPSRSLRLHVCARLVERLGATAGVIVQTLHAAAVEILERAGETFAGSDELVAVLSRRRAHEDPALREAFEPFADGYRTVAGSVRDLLDAGFEPAGHEAAVERLEALRMPAGRRRRARGLMSTARAVSAHLATHGLGGRSEVLRRARNAFDADPDGALPSRLLLVHGFADATGRALELLESLIRRLPARVLLDHPPDPDEPERADLGVVFTRRLSTRIEGHAGKARVHAPNGFAVERELFRAPGAEAEAREVARRVRRALDAGVPPERIGIVARDLGPYRTPLRNQLGRLGIPFSGLRARAPLDGPGRRIRALCELFVDLEREPTDRWLDAVATIPAEKEGKKQRRPPNADLRLALRVVGAVRVVEAAELAVEQHLDDKGRVVLPVRAGVTRRREGTEEREGRRRGHPGDFLAPRRKLPGAELRGAADAARALRRRFRRWPREATLARHLEELEKLRRRDLGWGTRDEAEQRIRGGIERLAEAFLDEELSFEELALVLERTLAPLAFPRINREGGDDGGGGGVQVLDAMEARARTFERLFLVGLNRDTFPRVPREDPLLPDDLRRALADVLPDVPIKARSRDEDRYLFAQLVSSSPHVTLSWQLADDDGRPRVVSPLVERLLREEDESSVDAVAPLFPQEPGRAFADRDRPAREHAVLAGLHGELVGRRMESDARFAPYLQQALEEAGVARSREVAAARQRVLDAFEAWAPEALAPWLGFLGAQADDAIRPDPREVPPYVTRLEATAKCPWQTLLQKLLRLEQVRDPLDGLPGVDPLLLGTVVHQTLERIARAVIGPEEPDLPHALARAPREVPWPDDAGLDEELLAAARGELLGRFPAYPGLLRMIVEVARPYVLRARELLEKEGGRVHGVETPGQAVVSTPDGEIRVDFKADRVEERDGAVFLTDFKTGRVLSLKDFQAGMRQGRNLQPIVYGLARGTEGREVWGRYLFLRPELEADRRPDVGLSPGDRKKHQDGVARALATIQRGWLAGAFFPRLHSVRGDKEPEACRFCEVAHACLRRDSGARRRLVELVTGRGGGAEVAAMRALWMLGEPPEKKPRRSR